LKNLQPSGHQLRWNLNLIANLLLVQQLEASWDPITSAFYRFQLQANGLKFLQLLPYCGATDTQTLAKALARVKLTIFK
jgi:hypothetical protein